MVQVASPLIEVSIGVTVQVESLECHISVGL